MSYQLVLLDTHVFVWALIDPQRLSGVAKESINEAPARALSSASLFEIGFKEQIGKWPDMTPLVQYGLEKAAKDVGLEIVAANGRIMETAGAFDWPHRDPFDRIIAATAITIDAPLITRDSTLDGAAPFGLVTVW